MQVCGYALHAATQKNRNFPAQQYVTTVNITISAHLLFIRHLLPHVARECGHLVTPGIVYGCHLFLKRSHTSMPSVFVAMALESETC